MEIVNVVGLEIRNYRCVMDNYVLLSSLYGMEIVNVVVFLQSSWTNVLEIIVSPLFYLLQLLQIMSHIYH